MGTCDSDLEGRSQRMGTHTLVGIEFVCSRPRNSHPSLAPWGYLRPFAVNMSPDVLHEAVLGMRYRQRAGEIVCVDNAL